MAKTAQRKPRKPRLVYTISAGLEAGSMHITTGARLVAVVWGKGRTLAKINETAFARAETIAAALLRADMAPKPGDLEKASTEALRDICECGLKAGPIWRARVTVSLHAFRDPAGWYWRDAQETAGDDHGPHKSERAALLDAISHYGVDPDYLTGR